MKIANKPVRLETVEVFSTSRRDFAYHWLTQSKMLAMQTLYFVCIVQVNIITESKLYQYKEPCLR